MTPEFLQKLGESHPFISVCVYAGHDYVGIIQNRDDIVTTMYDYGSIVEADLKAKFLELGDVWWWESNRLIPINLFLKSEWLVFKKYTKTFNNKGLEIIHGPTTSLNELSARRSKRKSITLVKKLP
jgi:hypothetical protein